MRENSGYNHVPPTGGPKTEQTRYEACIDLSNFIAEHSGPQEIVILGADLCENPSQRGYDHLIAKFKVQSFKQSYYFQDQLIDQRFKT